MRVVITAHMVSRDSIIAGIFICCPFVVVSTIAGLIDRRIVLRFSAFLMSLHGLEIGPTRIWSDDSSTENRDAWLARYTAYRIHTTRPLMTRDTWSVNLLLRAGQSHKLPAPTRE